MVARCFLDIFDHLHALVHISGRDEDRAFVEANARVVSMPIPSSDGTVKSKSVFITFTYLT